MVMPGIGGRVFLVAIWRIAPTVMSTNNAMIVKSVNRRTAARLAKPSPYGRR
jgi:hypothetical protein